MTASIFGLRHGIVENPDHVVYARLPGYGLSEEGLAGVERLAEQISTTPVVAVYASPLQRAQETAAILASHHDLPVLTEPLLIEWSFWVRWQGVPWSELRDREPELFSAYAEDPGRLCPEDPLEAIGVGIVAWATRVAAEHDDGLVLAVSHEAPLKAALLAGRGDPTSAYGGLHVPHLGAIQLHPTPTRQAELSKEMNAAGLGAEYPGKTPG